MLSSDSSSALKLFHEGQQEKALELALSTLRHCPLHSEHFAEMSHLAGMPLFFRAKQGSLTIFEKRHQVKSA